MKFKIFSAFTTAVGLGLLLALTVAAQGADGFDVLIDGGKTSTDGEGECLYQKDQ